MKDIVYSSAEPLIVAVNPFKDIGCGSPQKLEEYRDAGEAEEEEKLPPHAFLASRRALRQLHALRKPQTIIVSGESGAGKTETTKLLMKYVASSRGSSLEMKIQSAIMAANPVLEAFGNAKTVRNNNSSRFGRFMQLDVGKEGGILHGCVEVFLLEKSRIVHQAENERSYHIFYQLLKGAPPFMKQRFQLLTMQKYAYLNPHCYDAPGEKASR
ncbi:UNVERIFIED_CONTAM: hypothetical protein H355_006515 [Colinus virginianus]|nr:hypothetical protein H355_006515 [Colinus virginianus]